MGAGRLRLAAALAAASLLVACPGPRDMLFPAPPPRAIEPQPGGRVVEFAVGPGRTGYALDHPAAPGAPTVVFFHGNGDQIAHLTGLAAAIARRGLGFHAVEYPGYGPAADQAVSEDAIYATAEAALTHLRDRLDVDPVRTVLMGQSLGTGVAAEMANRGFGARVILLSPFTSIPDMVDRLFSAPAGIVVRDVFDTRAKAPDIDQPVLIAHGDLDELIPVAMAHELDAIFPSSELVLIERAGHNDVWRVGGRTWLDRFEAFARGATVIRPADPQPSET